MTTFVTSVTPGGPAAKAGIGDGDVLLRIGDTSVHNNLGATMGVESVIRMLEPGAAVTVEWQPGTGGKSETATLTVGRANA